MNNQEKFATRSCKLKIHRANFQMRSSYPVRFSTDILFYSLVSFPFSCYVFVVAFLFLFLFFFYFLKLKTYILIHIWLCGRVSDKKNFTWPFSGNKTTFFGLSITFCAFHLLSVWFFISFKYILALMSLLLLATIVSELFYIISLSSVMLFTSKSTNKLFKISEPFLERPFIMMLLPIVTNLHAFKGIVTHSHAKYFCSAYHTLFDP